MTDITASYLRERLDYDPDTGIFRWKPISAGRNSKHWNATKAGSIAGSKNGKGYIYIYLDRYAHRAHRLAWLYVYGSLPRFEIDHIDRRRDNNRISNLRDVPSLVNVLNRDVRKSESGVDGVTRKIRKDNTVSWKAKFDNNHLGTFATADEAIAARRAAVVSYLRSQGAKL